VNLGNSKHFTIVVSVIVPYRKKYTHQMDQKRAPRENGLHSILSTYYSWYPIHRSIENLSGWKLHIFGNSIEDSVSIYNSLYNIIEKYKLDMKIASQRNLSAGIANIDNRNYGKCATIYLPISIFKENLLSILMKEIKGGLSGYKKYGFIMGDKSIDNKILYRYEFSRPIDPCVGANEIEYSNLYELNRGYYNVEGNPDPFLNI